MADCYFPNDMPTFVEEAATANPIVVISKSSLSKLLHFPYLKASDTFLRAALQLKQKVVKETWIPHRRGPRDWTLYMGTLGTALLLFKLFLVTNNARDLSLSANIVSSCHSASRRSSLSGLIPPFIDPSAGINFWE